MRLHNLYTHRLSLGRDPFQNADSKAQTNTTSKTLKLQSIQNLECAQLTNDHSQLSNSQLHSQAVNRKFMGLITVLENKKMDRFTKQTHLRT